MSISESSTLFTNAKCREYAFEAIGQAKCLENLVISDADDKATGIISSIGMY